ncbi:MAG: hypothetical protein CVT67_09830 [Actinobacteria bacterium HGW-Actinobacteria-7]|nr:MAG: hypothetical protein CVT67_09830 [Actinobacteria bacterium HGW-Actinobacteria-7]
MNDWDGVERRDGIKRRVRRVYRFVDRRSGFDRRKRYPILGTMRDQPSVLIGVLVVLNLLSLVDGYFTAAELGLGIASEGNPVLDALARRNPLLAVTLKIVVPLLVSAMVWHGRKTRVILGMALVALGLFAALVLYHLRGLGLI